MALNYCIIVLNQITSGCTYGCVNLPFLSTSNKKLTVGMDKIPKLRFSRSKHRISINKTPTKTSSTTAQIVPEGRPISESESPVITIHYI